MWDANSGKSRGYGFAAFKERAVSIDGQNQVSLEFIYLGSDGHAIDSLV